MHNLLKQFICHQVSIKDSDAIILSTIEFEDLYCVKALMPYGGLITIQDIDVSKDELFKYKEERKLCK